VKHKCRFPGFSYLMEHLPQDRLVVAVGSVALAEMRTEVDIARVFTDRCGVGANDRRTGSLPLPGPCPWTRTRNVSDPPVLWPCAAAASGLR
jgi:hypothetical protein